MLPPMTSTLQGPSAGPAALQGEFSPSLTSTHTFRARAANQIKAAECSAELVDESRNQVRWLVAFIVADGSGDDCTDCKCNDRLGLESCGRVGSQSHMLLTVDAEGMPHGRQGNCRSKPKPIIPHLL